VADVDALTEELRTPASEPAGAIVLLHGRGTSEQDVVPLIDVLDPRGRLVAACPRGPLELPPMGHQWYATQADGLADAETFLATFQRLQAWLEGLAARTGVPIERTVLGGFSQGAVMSWSLGAMRREDGPPPPRPAGILALSGFIPTVPGFAADDATLSGLPVAIAHGRQDPVIGVDFGRAARARAQQAGADVLYRESDVGHTIDPRVIPELVDWLRARP
jgi:phospholipase/carboxylesterase